jgi:hypothetical protein
VELRVYIERRTLARNNIQACREFCAYVWSSRQQEILYMRTLACNSVYSVVLGSTMTQDLGMELNACKEEKVRHRTKDMQTSQDPCRKLRECREPCMARLQDARLELSTKRIRVLAQNSALVENLELLQGTQHLHRTRPSCSELSEYGNLRIIEWNSALTENSAVFYGTQP